MHCDGKKNKKVENEVYKVPLCAFLKESEVFRNLFLLPRGDNEDVDGKSDARPLVLEGISSKDFSSLLKVLYPDASL